MGTLGAVNVASQDNGRRFTKRDRLKNIEHLLRDQGSPWNIRHEGDLMTLYSATTGPVKNTLTISSHVDARYQIFGHRYASEDRLVGSFDNAITNALLVDLMLRDCLPHGVLVAFTGDEEQNSRGADEVMDVLKAMGYPPALVLVTDVTDESVFGQHGFTLENWFVAQHPRLPTTEEAFLDLLLTPFAEQFLHTVHHSEAYPDESWEYDEQEVHCFSLCIPSAPADGNESSDDWMHDDVGIGIAISSIPKYSAALETLCRFLNDTLHPEIGERHE